jgi:type I restriction enzyme M protein
MKVNLEIFWIRHESLEDSEKVPEPPIILQEMIEDLESARDQFRGIAEELSEESTDGRCGG